MAEDKTKAICSELRHQLFKYSKVFPDGSVYIIELQQRLVRKGIDVAVKDLRRDPKFKVFGNLVRANNGHSLESAKLFDPTKLLTEITLQNISQHATYKSGEWCFVKGVTRYEVSDIRRNGLHVNPRNRIMLHLQKSHRREDGFKYSPNAMVWISATRAMQDGMQFYVSCNGVIQTSGFAGCVPSKYLRIQAL